MDSLTAPARPAGVSGRLLAVLAAVAAALAAAFVVAPPVLAVGTSGGGLDDRRHLVGVLREEFVGYWRSGDQGFPPGLQRVVDYWVHYHLAKAVIAAALLIVLVALGVLLWKAYLGAGGLGRGTRVTLGSAGVLVSVLALFSMAMVMANAQGVVAPFASLLPMLTDGPADTELTDTLAQVRQHLTDPPLAAGEPLPAVAAMTSDFSRYHAALAVIAAIVAVVLIGVGLVLWKRFAGTSDRRTRRLLGSYAALSAVLSLAVIVVAVANTATAANPTPALLAFFEGGW